MLLSSRRVPTLVGLGVIGSPESHRRPDLPQSSMSTPTVSSSPSFSGWISDPNHLGFGPRFLSHLPNFVAAMVGALLSLVHGGSWSSWASRWRSQLLPLTRRLSCSISKSYKANRDPLQVPRRRRSTEVLRRLIWIQQ